MLGSRLRGEDDRKRDGGRNCVAKARSKPKKKTLEMVKLMLPACFLLNKSFTLSLICLLLFCFLLCVSTFIN